MDIPQVLAVLAPGVPWGPCAQTGATYPEFEQGWLSVYGPDDPPPTEAEMEAVWAGLEATRGQREAQARNAAAVAIILTGREPHDVAIAAFFRDLYTQLNDLRQAQGLPRILEPEIVARIVSSLQPA